MRLIDADKLITPSNDDEKTFVIGIRGSKFLHLAYEFMKQKVSNASTVDAVPVVRCKDCEHGVRAVDNYVRCSHPCGKVLMMTAIDFCSYGKRRESNSGC